MSGPRILVVDDEPQIREALCLALSADGFDVDCAADGQGGLDLATARPPDVVLLDLMLPDGDGLEICGRLRQRTAAPIIILSAKVAEREKVRALDCGADDYLTKPFGIGELLARIRVALRHAQSRREPPRIVQSGAVEIDLERRLVRLAGQDVHLTPAEYGILSCLASQPGRVLSHRQLLQSALGVEYGGATPNLRVFVASLRRKLEVDPARPRLVVTESGVGYRLKIE